MNKEKEIVRMRTTCKSLEIDGRDIQSVVETLVNNGIGDVRQAVKEFAEKLKSGTHRFGVVDGNNYYVWYDTDIDNLITELYGANERS